tara:strand:+ start:22556 stop:22999 length:444 start_codon:yes stop_codon:yes gene_type:complete
MATKKHLSLFFLSLFLLTTNFNIYGTTSIKKNKTPIERLPTMVETLQYGEHFTIEITSVGCFAGKQQTIRIINNNGVLTASLNSSTILLTEANINELIRFELQLRELQIGGCTTVDTYVLSNAYETYKTSDGTCSWLGYKQLIALFE